MHKGIYTILIKKCIILVILCISLLSCDQETLTQYGFFPKLLSNNPKFKINTPKNNNVDYYNSHDTIRIAAVSLPSTNGIPYLDPHNPSSETELQLAHALFSTLTVLDAETGAPRPSLAQAWTVQKLPNGFTYIFTIRDNVTWSDGTPVVAEQIKQSLLRALNPRNKNKYAAELAFSISGAAHLYSLSTNSSDSTIIQAEQQVQINAIDDTTLYITPTSKAVPLLQTLAHPISSIIPIQQSMLEAQSMFILDNTTWIGLGAFIPSAIQSNMITLETYSNFWSKPWVNTLQIVLEESLEQAIRQYANNTVDWVLMPSIEYLVQDNNISTLLYNNQDIALTTNLLAVPYSGHTILEIPSYSILQQINNKLELQALINTLTEQTRNYHTTIYNTIPHASSTLFVPNIAWVYTQDTSTEVFFEDNSIDTNDDIPNEILDNEFTEEFDTNNTEQILHAESTTIDNIAQENSSGFQTYINSLFNLVGQRTGSALSIAYTHPSLKIYTEYTAQFFRNYGISTELLSINQNSNAQYDIALHTLPTTSHTSGGYTSQIWSILYNQDNIVKANGFLATSFDTLLNESYNKNSNAYFNAIQKIIEYAEYSSTISQLWFSNSQELINRDAYLWWTPRMSWHPLYP